MVRPSGGGKPWPGDPHGVPRCWDFNPSYFGTSDCSFGSGQNQCPLVVPPQQCVGGLCAPDDCGGLDGVGVCRAAMRVCDTFLGECIPAPKGCTWPTTTGVPPSPACTHEDDWCPQ